MNTKTKTTAQQIADRFGNDGLRWRLEDGKVTSSGQTWTIPAWTFADGSQIGEVTEGGWDILDRYPRAGDVITAALSRTGSSR